jgi:RNA polymerase sigma-70 factor, ECF subfamily
VDRETEWAAWMRQGMDGDELSYRQLLESLGRQLRVTVRYRFARAGMGNSDVEDVVQETLLAIHLKRHTWDREARFGPWLAAITRHKLIDVLRRRGRQVAVPLDDVEQSLFQHTEEEGASEDVHRILGRLTVRQRAIVQLVSIEGQSFKQAAVRLQMSEVAVRVALHRTLKTLAAIYRADT